MKIVIKATNTKLTKGLQDLIEEKINSLEKFAKIFSKDKYYNGFFGKGKPKAEAWVELERTTRHHRKGPIFRAECQMHLPNRSIRAEAIDRDLKLAITKLKDELKTELKKYKERLMALTKRKARVMRKELKLSPLARLYRKGRIREEGI